jgi:hypothetical protein
VGLAVGQALGITVIRGSQYPLEAMSNERTRLFSEGFDDEFAVGAEPGNTAFFGRDVLRGLITGIEDFAETRQERWKRYRSLGPALVACAPWMDDEELLGRLGGLAAACVLVSKQRRNANEGAKLERLRRVNDTAPGLPIRAFPYLGGLAPKVDGQPLVVGPFGPPMDEAVLSTIRTIGYRKAGRADSPPLAHAKLALLGHLWWHDEGVFGVEDVVGFAPYRLWISSANFTKSSRRSLEFGYWTEDEGLIEGAERFLLRLIAASEGLDPAADVMDPDLVPVEFDDQAMWEALREASWDDQEDDEDGGT